MEKAQPRDIIKPGIFVIISYLILGCSFKAKVESSPGGYSDISDFFPKDTLFKVSNDHGNSTDVGYVNQDGDTIIPYGRFTVGFSDTILTYGIVLEKIDGNEELIGINQNGERLYEVVWFDNGPDYIEEGMFRISRDGKIGFADTTGKIVIEPNFACAYPFYEGKAKVSYECKKLSDQEHQIMQSQNWFYIDKNGKIDTRYRTESLNRF